MDPTRDEGPEDSLDYSSLCDSEFTYSSSSTVWGPGALAGKFLKAIGEKSLDFITSVIIRRRLAIIKQTLEKNSHIFCDPQTPNEWHQVNEMYADLREVCRESYSLSLRRTAANIVRNIATTAQADSNNNASPIWSLWRPLLVRLQRPGGLLSVPQETVITADKHAYDASNHMGNQEHTSPLDPNKPIEIGVTVDISQSYDPVTNLNRKVPPFRRRLSGARRTGSLWNNACRNLNDQCSPDTTCHASHARSTTKTFGWSCLRSEPELMGDTSLVLPIRDRIKTPRRKVARRFRPFKNKSNSSYIDRPDMILNYNEMIPHDVGEQAPIQQRSSIYADDGKTSSHLHYLRTTTSPCGPGLNRTVSEIQRHLDDARKVVNDLEMDLMYATLSSLDLYPK